MDRKKENSNEKRKTTKDKKLEVQGAEKHDQYEETELNIKHILSKSNISDTQDRALDKHS